MTGEPESIAAWQRLNGRITTSGRITASDVVTLQALGVRHVVNLALATSPGAFVDEETALAVAGLRYTHIPVPFDAPEDDHFAAFCAALGGDYEPVHVHCIANWRVSAFFYRWHRDVQGMPEPDARALMERQWSPETSDNRDAPAWTRFIARRNT